jgi:hypothetical protein
MVSGEQRVSVADLTGADTGFFWQPWHDCQTRVNRLTGWLDVSLDLSGKRWHKRTQALPVRPAGAHA